jgi:polysaccharide export outer membrane protein
MRVTTILTLAFACAALCSAQNESLTIGPGDSLQITVMDVADLSQEVRVTDSGDVKLILGGSVRVSGLSADQAAKTIEKKLIDGDYVLNPHVSVLIGHSATKNVTAVGQVSKPGSYDIGTPRTILDIVALAGGLTDVADKRITIERGDTKEQIEYFVSNSSSAALKDQPLVYPGDTVLVPKARIVYMLGDVGRPGGYPANTNDSQLTVLQALAMAGGTPPTAMPSKARLIRKAENGTYVEIQLQLSDMQKGKRSDFPMQPDDIVYVPFSYLKNMAVNLDALVAAATTASIYRF